MGKTNQVPVTCAVCKTAWTVKASRAAQNNAITCSKACLGELRSRNRIKHFGSAEARQATCPVCGEDFERKPSQLAKYGQSYCSRACGAVGKQGPKPDLRTGEWLPCETCGQKVWRTAATKQPHTFCSRTCAGKMPRGPRVERTLKPCECCSAVMVLLPSDAARYRFCSMRCAARTIQGAKRGKPGTPWTPEQRETLSATLTRKYQNEWATKKEDHSERMAGAANPQWKDGSATQPYARGFTHQLKRRIAKRDGYVCRACLAPHAPGTHVVHHIDGKKTDHRESNLILLCRPCHGRVHGGTLTLTLATDT